MSRGHNECARGWALLSKWLRRLNLLIAAMGHSFENVKADETAVARFEQAQVIVTFQRRNRLFVSF